MKIPGARNKPITETQMISLADIAFLIIFFFLMASSFMKDRAKIEMPVLPREDQVQSSITVVMDKAGAVFLDGEKVDTPAALGNLLKGRLQGKKPEDCKVRFRCEKTVQHKVYSPVVEAIAGAGATVAIIHNVPK